MIAACPHGDKFCPCPDGSVCHYDCDPHTGTYAAPCPRTGQIGCVCRPRFYPVLRGDYWLVADRHRLIPAAQFSVSGLGRDGIPSAWAEANACAVRWSEQYAATFGDEAVA